MAENFNRIFLAKLLLKIYDMFKMYFVFWHVLYHSIICVSMDAQVAQQLKQATVTSFSK